MGEREMEPTVLRFPQSEESTTLSLLIEVRDELLERGELLKAKAVENAISLLNYESSS